MLQRFALLPALVAFLAVWFAPTRGAEPTPEGIEFFEKKVRPLLVAHCQSCHSAEKKQKANLVLDSKASLMKGGDSGPPVVAGSPEKSLLVKAIGYTEELRMPPKGKLSAEQIADLTTWVKMGAPWPETATKGPATGKEAFDIAARKKAHWCWQPVQTPKLPEVKQKDWPKSPIDHFILAKLEAKGLKPAPPADPRILIRRVTFDLTGLPPTPEEVEAFVQECNFEGLRPRLAYEKLVDRLLASPHYGERWARHWLDLVRFAETYGHEFDFEIPEAYQYRDYVIRAFNDDVPYDQLVREHIAGDLLPSPRRHSTDRFNESILGTGFWFLGEAKHSPVNIRGDEADRIDNQIDVFSKTFLGLTVACARCHDHKFDAISTADFYSLYGYLSSSRFQRAFIDHSDRTGPTLKKLTDLRDEMAKLSKPRTADRLRARIDGADFDKLGGPGDVKRPEHPLHAWYSLAGKDKPEEFATAKQQLLDRLRAQTAKSAEVRAKVVRLGEAKDDWFFTGDAFQLTRGGELIPSQIGAVATPGQLHSGLLSGQLKGTARSQSFVLDKNKVLVRISGSGLVNLVIDNFQLIRAPIYGGLTFQLPRPTELHWLTIDVRMWQGHRAYLEVIDDGPGQIAIEEVLLTNDGPPPDPPSPLLVKLVAEATDYADLNRRGRELLRDIIGQWEAGKLVSADRIGLLNWLLQTLPLAEPDAKLAGYLDQFRQVEVSLPAPRRGLAMADGNGTNEHVFIRGNHKNLGPEVPRRFLEALPSPLAGEGPGVRGQPSAGSGRLDLANRVADPANPLTARVMVNRLWQHHFGEGLVRSVDNFGVLGELPSHPELLDFLANFFVSDSAFPAPNSNPQSAIRNPQFQWSIKKMHRAILLSSTYQMSSQVDPKAKEIDPRNQLLHAMPVRRLEAEAIRDSLLAISGRLDRTMYGPGPQPHLTPFMAGRGRPAGGPLDGQGRRSIYINVRRNFLTPLFLAFDYPVPFSTMGKRTSSNVPAQALAMLNNPFVLQQADLWAKKSLAEPGSAKDRIVKMYVSAFARPPSDAELAGAMEFLEGRTGDPQAWADLAHVLVNVKEFIFLN